MMATVSTKPMKADEFFEFIQRPENRERVFELDHGQVVEMTRAGVFHGFVCGNIAYLLGTFARRRKQGFVCTNNPVLLVQRDPDTVYRPDLVFYDDTALAEEFGRGSQKTLPRLVIDVVLPAERPGRIYRRVYQYLQGGVPHIWIVDPDDQSVTGYQRGKEFEIFDSLDEITGGQSLPDLRLAVKEIFTLPHERNQENSRGSKQKSKRKKLK